ncbi:MAG: hypothetical protein M3R36_01845 [Bacteroidota bacterium]|nr:hypothetical protein [Bacteroidota bacterium]
MRGISGNILDENYFVHCPPRSVRAESPASVPFRFKVNSMRELSGNIICILDENYFVHCPP